MRHFPILDELFSSDSVVFLIVGLVIAMLIGVKMKETKKRLLGLAASVLLYAACESISNFHTTYLLELILLVVGTSALGSMLGFLITIAAKAKR